MDTGYSLEQTLMNKGVYSLPQAARIASFVTGRHVTATAIRRWLWGAERRRAGKTYRSLPLWSPELPLLHSDHVLSFRDLIETLFVAAFRQRGVSLQTIRRVIDQATVLMTDPYPLSSPEFLTDGTSVLTAAADADERRLLFDLDTGQLLLAPFFERLQAEIRYSDLMEAMEFYPLGRERQVVMDPTRRFGEPIVVDTSIPTHILASAYEAEGKSVEAVSYWFGVSAGAVRDAVDYETRLRTA